MSDSTLKTFNEKSTRTFVFLHKNGTIIEANYEGSLEDLMKKYEIGKKEFDYKFVLCMSKSWIFEESMLNKYSDLDNFKYNKFIRKYK
jgi:hypothetical protein